MTGMLSAGIAVGAIAGMAALVGTAWRRSWRHAHTVIATVPPPPAARPCHYIPSYDCRCGNVADCPVIQAPPGTYLVRPPVTEHTMGYAEVEGAPPWEIAGGLMYGTAGIMGCDSGAMAAVTDPGGGGGSEPDEPGPAWYPSNEIAHRCDDCGAWRAEDMGRPVEPHEDGCIYLEDAPEWTPAELARLHDAPTVFDVNWVDSWLSDGWAARMAAEIGGWRGNA